MVDGVGGVSSGRAVSLGVSTNVQSTTASRQPNMDFGAVLDKALQSSSSVKLSAHAQRRLESRDIHLDESDMSKIEKAVSKAGEKGSKESLVLLDDLAFVVSVKNRTVITAMNLPDIKDGVITSIDSVVMA